MLQLFLQTSFRHGQNIFKHDLVNLNEIKENYHAVYNSDNSHEKYLRTHYPNGINYKCPCGPRCHGNLLLFSIKYTLKLVA